MLCIPYVNLLYTTHIERRIMLYRFAQIISLVFHPLLMTTYTLIILLLVNPYMFGYNDLNKSWLLVLQVFLNSFVMPAAAIMMMLKLGFISSIEVENQRERVFPYIAAGIFYLWVCVNAYHNPAIPVAFTAGIVGATMGLFIAFFVNIFYKISAHAIGVGGLVGAVIIMMFRFSYSMFPIHWFGTTIGIQMSVLLSICLLIAGLVGSARLILKVHEPLQLYLGFSVGILTQLLAIKLLM
jgi:hypothetical protein